MASLAASEIQSQLTSLKEAARSRSPGELGRVDQVLESCEKYGFLFTPGIQIKVAGRELYISALSYLLTLTLQVCQEFMDLKIPRHAEILDVAAGSGILSAELQTGG